MKEWDRPDDLQAPETDRAQGSEKNSPVFNNTQSPEVPQADPVDVGDERELPPDPRDGVDQQPEEAPGAERTGEVEKAPGDKGPSEVDAPGQNPGESPVDDENPPLS